MALLEHHDELGLPWAEWADGRVHRLVKGRDFLQSAEVLKQAAENAARRLGKVALTVKEARFGRVYVWLEFVDHEIALPEPCPCGSTDLRAVNQQLAECMACNATLLLVKPKVGKNHDDPSVSTEDDALVHSLLTMQGAAPARKGAKVGRAGAVARLDPGAPEAGPGEQLPDPRTDLRRLGPFRSLALFRDGSAHGVDRYYGTAVGPGNRNWLTVVDFALSGGEWIQSETDPGGWSHAVWGVPHKPFAQFVQLAPLSSREPDLRIDDPFVDDYSDRSSAPSGEEEGGRAEGPPVSVFDLVDLSLFVTGRDSEEVERFVGTARTPEGRDLLVFVRFRLRDGSRLEDPGSPGMPLHDLDCVPARPFGDAVNLAVLRSKEPDLAVRDPRTEFAVGATS